MLEGSWEINMQFHEHQKVIASPVNGMDKCEIRSLVKGHELTRPFVAVWDPPSGMWLLESCVLKDLGAD
jgi:hypothetical protein